MKKIFFLLFSLGCFSSFGQTLKTPAPSPLQTIKQAFALSEITVEYSRPSAKGRTVYGDVVPFGQIWRTGANGATTLTFGEDVTFGGQPVSAGTYALYSIPGKESWELMLYSDLKLGGNVTEYNKEKEVKRISVKPGRLNDKVETFTIAFNDITPTTVNIEILWENTKISIPVVADIDAKIMKNIESAVIKDNRPYYQAARYYYDNDKDLKLALEWVNKAVDNNPQAYWIHMLKANIQSKSGDKAGAKTTAQKVIELAKADGDDAYVKQAEKLLSQIK